MVSGLRLTLEGVQGLIWTVGVGHRWVYKGCLSTNGHWEGCRCSYMDTRKGAWAHVGPVKGVRAQINIGKGDQVHMDTGKGAHMDTGKGARAQ